MTRAMRFYREVFDAWVARESEIMTELTIAGGTLGIHSARDGKRTWTELAFQAIFALDTTILVASASLRTSSR